MRKNYVLRLATFTLILALLVGTGSVSAYGYEEELHFTHDQSLDSLDLEEETTNDEQSSNSLTLEFIEEIDNVKENIFNNRRKEKRRSALRRERSSTFLRK